MTEGIEYYINKEGKWVFTEKYHQARGYCCGQGCKHCAYNYEAVPEPVKKRLQVLNQFSKSTNTNAVYGQDE